MTRHDKASFVRPAIARRTLLALLGALLLPLIIASSAHATKNIVGYFGSHGQDPDQLPSFPRGVDINQGGNGPGASAGDIYAITASSTQESNAPDSAKILQFDSSGDFIREFGWDVLAEGPDNTGANEQQSVTIPPTVTGGTFNLTVTSVFGEGGGQINSTEIKRVDTYVGLFQVGQQVVATNFPPGTKIVTVGHHALQLSKPADLGGSMSIRVQETTAAIPYNATAGDVQAALEALPGIGPGGVAVTGGPGASGTPFTVTFIGGRRLAHSDVPLMSPTNHLVGGAPTVAVVTEGGGPEVCNVGVDPISACRNPVSPADQTTAGNVAGNAPSMVIDQVTGSVYAGGGSGFTGPHRISIFKSDGTYEATFGYGVLTGGSELEFCTTICKEGKKSIGANMAIDPTTGDIFSTGQNSIEKYKVIFNGSDEPTGVEFLADFGWGVATEADAFEVCTSLPCKPGLAGEEVGQVNFVEDDLAVDPTGVVYASSRLPGSSPEFRNVQAFTPSGGGYVPSLFASDINGQLAIAPDNHVFITDRDIPSPVSTCFNGLPPRPGETRILEFDTTGALVATHATCPAISFEWENYFFGDMSFNTNSGALYVATSMSGFGVSADERISVLDTLEPPSMTMETVTATTNGAIVTGTVEPNGPAATYPHPSSTGYQAEYKLASEAGWTKFGKPIDVGAGFGSHQVIAHLGGLEPNESYEVRLVALKPGVSSDTTAPQAFHTLPVAPTIQGLSSKAVTATSADLLAKINPHGVDTQYYFEYGTGLSYGQQTAEIDIGEGFAPQGVVGHIEGLTASTYHFRVVAHSSAGTTTSGDRTFTFYPPTCPNDLVRQQTGSEYLPDCRAYELVSPANAGNILFRSIFGSPAPYATNPPRFLYGGIAGGIEGTEGINSNSFDIYVATRTPTGWVTTYPGVPGSQTGVGTIGMGNKSLDTFIAYDNETEDTPPFVYDSEENALGRWPGDVGSVPGGEEAIGVFQPSPDFSHMAFATQTDFDPNGEGVTSAPGSAYDYDTATQTTTLISRTASGPIQQDPEVSDATETIQFAGRTEPRTRQIFPGVSTDGSHILMTTNGPAPCSGFLCKPPLHLYMSVNDAPAYEIAGGAAVNYIGMTADGTKLFFTSDLKLTADDHDTSADLYMWSEKGQKEGEPLARLSVGSEGTGDTDTCSPSWISKCGAAPVAGEFQTDLPVATETGDVYFYSPELLDGPENGLEGAQNLYVYRNGHPEYVTTLNFNGNAPLTRIQVSPDGAHAAFVTASRLTAYDNAGKKEMYTFDAASGSLICISCKSDGEPPVGDVEGSAGGLFMSDDGRAFFSTKDALVAADTNEGFDVYEYSEGRPQLISSGTGDTHARANHKEDPIALMGVSVDGADAYFSSYDKLVSQDNNGAFLKFYDARTNGGFPVEASNLPCEAADECHGAGSSPPPPPLITSGHDLGASGNLRPKHRRKHRHHRHRRKTHKHRHGGRNHG